MDEPTTSKGRTGEAGTRTVMALRVTGLIAVIAAVVSFGALRYVEHGIRGSLAQQQFALVQGIISEAAIYLSLGILLATVAVLVLVWKLTKCLTTPLATLVRQVEVMEETGELSRLESADLPEIGRVAEAFNRMA